MKSSVQDKTTFDRPLHCISLCYSFWPRVKSKTSPRVKCSLACSLYLLQSYLCCDGEHRLLFVVSY